jgi:DNA-binding transcriptional LysR family regulator
MDLQQLRCFVVTAEELHFGRAAQKLGMMPSALGRHIKLLEEELATRLIDRTTRSVALTGDGALLLDHARALLADAANLESRFRASGRKQSVTLRLGAIDSAAVGLVPRLLRDFRTLRPDVEVRLFEDKTIHLLPRLISGRIDLALVRPPEIQDKRLEFLFLFYETPVVAFPERHIFARRSRVSIEDLANQPLIVAERRSRPHSHDLTVKLFAEAGLQPHVAQYAEEKQTIVNLVAENLGVAIVPRWTSRISSRGVCYVPLEAPGEYRLPLGAAWPRGSRDSTRDEMIKMLQVDLAGYALDA